MNNLQLVLLTNSLFSLFTGLSLILFRNSFANWFGEQKHTVFSTLGLGLLLFSSFVLVQTIKPEREVVHYIILLDAFWVAASVGLLIIKPWSFTHLGNKIVAVVALIVLLLGIGQAIEIWK